jgi:hypothetical protein
MARRMAKGEIVPSKVTGTINRTNTAVNEPNKMPTCSWSKASAAIRNTGRETKGTNPALKPAQASTPYRV